MSKELNLRFPSPDTVIVSFDEGATDALDFKNPLDEAVLKEIHWYLEIYARYYSSTPDDERAERIAKQLQIWGEQLFAAVFGTPATQRLFTALQALTEEERLVTISSQHPEILGLPWELLCDPDGTFLFHARPQISIRRHFSDSPAGRGSFQVKSKKTLRLLFVVSRPTGVEFIDPRSGPQAVMASLDAEAQGRVEVEFLRPATLAQLVARLENEDLPPVDILHFDAHGAFDPDGRMQAAAEQTIIPDSIADLVRKDAQRTSDNVGYLLFENGEGDAALVSADLLGDMLHQMQIPLVILSASQSTAVGGENAVGSVAARLTHAGIPTVLAMTHSGAAVTLRALCGYFYHHLARGKTVGHALDNARQQLYQKPERGLHLWGKGGNQSVELKLHDWFLPALYQAGSDVALLEGETVVSQQPDASSALHNLPTHQEAGFWGRRKELWQIERAFVQGTQRVSITGIGGQGKTDLATEAGAWLLRTGLFARVCFVSYANFEGVDPVGLAVSTLNTVLEGNLADAEAAQTALATMPTLVILDNLEALSPEGLQELLDTAQLWSEAGDSRVLLTTRQPDFQHPAYPVADSQTHWRLSLAGLDPEDALQYFQQWVSLSTAPSKHQLSPKRGALQALFKKSAVHRQLPERAALLALFEKVAFHPLSINVLAQQIMTRRSADLTKRLNGVLAAIPNKEKHRVLLASLQVSLERLSAGARMGLPRLGVFRGGAMEDIIQEVVFPDVHAEKGKAEVFKQVVAAVAREDGVALLKFLRSKKNGSPPPLEGAEEALQHFQQKLPQVKQRLAELRAIKAHKFTPKATASTWPELKQYLIATGLVDIENLAGADVSYLRFHPSLATVLWATLDTTHRKELTQRHLNAYYRLSRVLYYDDDHKPQQTRTMAERELPNLLSAVYVALAADHPDAADFADNINRFLSMLGLRRDHQTLVARSAQVASESGSRSWFLAQSGRGEQLYDVGQYAEAQQVFMNILNSLNDKVSYEKCVALHRLGRCLWHQGQLNAAERHYRKAIAVAERLAQTDIVNHESVALQMDLADVCVEQGDYAGAQAAYEASLAIATMQNNQQQMGIFNEQLGFLALQQDNLNAAVQHYREALSIFQNLQKPAAEAMMWDQLGIAYRKAQQWDAAEQAFHAAAKLKENQGDLSGVASSLNALATVTEFAGKIADAEAWYHKALEATKTADDRQEQVAVLYNLAVLLQKHSLPRLTEARQLAEEALDIANTLEDVKARISNIYSLLADIAEQQGATLKALDYRHEAEQARIEGKGAMQELLRYRELIALVVAAKQGEIQAKTLASQYLAIMREGDRDWLYLAETIEHLLADTYQETMLDQQGAMQYMILGTILRALDEPAILQGLLEIEA